jgi:hypothetical protein
MFFTPCSSDKEATKEKRDGELIRVVLVFHTTRNSFNAMINLTYSDMGDYLISDRNKGDKINTHPSSCLFVHPSTTTTTYWTL